MGGLGPMLVHLKRERGEKAAKMEGHHHQIQLLLQVLHLIMLPSLPPPCPCSALPTFSLGGYLLPWAARAMVTWAGRLQPSHQFLGSALLSPLQESAFQHFFSSRQSWNTHSAACNSPLSWAVCPI